MSKTRSKNRPETDGPQPEKEGQGHQGPVDLARFKVGTSVPPLYFRPLGSDYLVTNDAGKHAFLSPGEFRQVIEGRFSPSSDRYDELVQKGFVDSGHAAAILEQGFSARNRHLLVGPSLHILILTLRCNQQCGYCQASRRPMSAPSVDMSVQTSKRILDMVFQSPSAALTIEFQGGEPLVNFEVLKAVVLDAEKRNETQHRTLYFSVVTNLTLMDEDKLDFLLDHNVTICTSLDGPKSLHDANRPWSNRSSYDHTVTWIERIRQAYRDRGFGNDEYQLNALLTVTHKTLSKASAIVNEYVRLGFRVIHLRPLQPFGLADRTWKRQGYSDSAFLSFYREALDAILALNDQGIEIQEKTASLFLTKMLTDHDPNYMDLRTPCGAAIGQLAYNYDGRVYPCDEARMVAAMGDDVFRIGSVFEDSYETVIRHDTVRAMATASCLEAIPGCAHCAYKPYCGVCPVLSYVSQGDIFARQPTSSRCRTQMGIQDLLFAIMKTADTKTLKILKRWTEQREPVASGRHSDKVKP